jgi:hypothetical protein
VDILTQAYDSVHPHGFIGLSVQVFLDALHNLWGYAGFTRGLE